MSDIERDDAIFCACEELDKFKDYFDTVQIEIFKKSINRPPANNIFPEIEWNCKYVEQSIQGVKTRIMDSISRDILKEVRIKKVSDPLFIGGSYSIALRLCIKYFFKYENVVSRDDMPAWFLSSCRYFNISFSDFVILVEKQYEKKFMRYRLWDEKSINALQNYIFRAHKDFDEFECPAIQEYCDPTDDVLSKAAFVEVIEDILLNYPLHNFCEIRFPPYNDDGYIFSEFVPVKDMPERYIDTLYCQYLREFEQSP